MAIKVLTWNKPRTPTEKELKETLEKEGMKPYHDIMERDEFVDAHQHNYDEVRILVSGKIEFCAEGRCHVLKPGDRIELIKGTTHTAKNLERGQSVMLCATIGERVYVERY